MALAEPCGPYLLSAGPAGREYVSLRPGTLNALAKRRVVNREFDEHETLLDKLDRDKHATAAALGWKKLAPTLFDGPEAEAHLKALAAWRAERDRVSSRDLRTRRALRDTMFVAALREEAFEVLKLSLHHPAPAWAASLTLAGKVRVVDHADGFEARVAVKGKGGRVYDVYLAHSESRGFRTGVLLSAVTRQANPYYYDDFKIGTVLDEEARSRVAHTSVDQRLVALGIQTIPHAWRARLGARMAASAVLRRQVAQVLRAAERVNRTRDFESTHLLHSYVNYWANANILDERKMLKSSLMIAALNTKEERNYVARAIDESTLDPNGEGFSQLVVKLRLKQWWPGIPRTPYDGDLLWYYVDQDDDVARAAEVNEHGVESELSERLALNTFDDPRFVENEKVARPGETHFRSPATDDSL